MSLRDGIIRELLELTTSELRVEAMTRGWIIGSETASFDELLEWLMEQRVLEALRAAGAGIGLGSSSAASEIPESEPAPAASTAGSR